MRKHLPLRKKLLASLIRTAVIATAMGPTISWAQSADATLRGKAPPNAVVTAKNIETGAVRRTTASGDGSYALVGLPAGAYAIDAGASAQNVTLSVASTFTLDLTAAPSAPPTTATTLEGVSVTATTLQEVKTSEIGTVVSQRQIETVPQITRNFLEFADTVPGMVFSVDDKGNTSLKGGGISTSGINVFIDGVGQKNYVLPSGLTGQTSSQGNPFPQLAIGEYKVITSNYKAEYDQISSAAITAETKSGTNEFHGDVFGDYTDADLRKRTPAETAANKKTASQEKEYGFDIGGPIIKDTMHFFLAYEAKQFVTPVAVTPSGPEALFAELPDSAKAQLGPTSEPFNEDLWFAKVDWELTDRDRIEASGKYRDETAISGVSGAVAPSAATNSINTDKRYDIRWQHSADSWFNELLATYEDSFFNATALNFGAGSVYTDSTSSNSGTILDVGPATPLAAQNKGQKGPAIADNLTFNDISWHGDHVVKMGFKFKSVKLTAEDSSDINPQFYYDVTPTGTLSTPWKVDFPIVTPGLSPIAQTTDKQYGGYIQDDWSVNDKLTLNLGVRYDYEKTPSYLNYVTPASVVAAFNKLNPDPNAPAGQTYAQALALGGVNVNDYISNGHNRKQQKDAIAPRLGFSYDFFGDEVHVLHGGAGRSYDRDIFEILQLEQTKQALGGLELTFPNQFHTCTPSPNCLPFDPSFLDLGTLQSLYGGSTAGKEVDAINNNLKTPYSDQFSLGIRNKVGDWNTDATVQRINGKDGLVFTLGQRYPDGGFFEPQGCATCISQPWNQPIPGFGNFIIGNNGGETKTTQVLLSAEKPYTKESGWAATIAYTYTNTKQNNDNGDLTDQYAFDEATIGDYPFIASQVAKHRLVATGSVDGPWDMLYSMKLTLATPLPDDNRACPGGNGAPNVKFPTGDVCTPIAAYPGGQSFITGGKVFGYRSIDLQATKNFDFTAGLSAYIRVDALNVFNYHNYTSYVENFGSGGIIPRRPVEYSTTGNIDGVPRTLKFSVGFRW